MKTLKEHFDKCKKEEIYSFYQRLIVKPKAYNRITRREMYEEIIAVYKEDPEEILRLSTIEEIEFLKHLLTQNIDISNGGYIEYIMYSNLKNNFLILDDFQNKTEYIPADIINYVKMAINLYNEKEYSLKDVKDSVILGLIRIHNVIKVDELLKLLPNYYVNMSKKELEEYLRYSPKLNDKVKIIRYQKEEYAISLEYYYYKDVLKLSKENFKYKIYTLESVISIGKYKMNLFNEEIFKFLSFLEMHLHPKYIIIVIAEMAIYAGFYMNNETTLRNIADNVEELFHEIIKVIDYFPIWIYKGNDGVTIKDNIILPDKNAPCPCGSGKKYKKCCGK